MNIKHLLFDLDNTLYPSTAAMDQGITRRMIGFVADFLGLDFQQATERRIQRLPFYGTTLEWLKTEHGLTDIGAYFNAVHPPEEIEELNPDPNLRPLLQSLELPMTILTNAPLCHAQRILEFLNVADLFTSIHAVLVQHPEQAGHKHPLDNLSSPERLPQLVIPSVYQVPQVLEQLTSQDYT